jgi:hypothetical protein
MATPTKTPKPRRVSKRLLAKQELGLFATADQPCRQCLVERGRPCEIRTPGEHVPLGGACALRVRDWKMAKKHRGLLDVKCPACAARVQTPCRLLACEPNRSRPVSVHGLRRRAHVKYARYRMGALIPADEASPPPPKDPIPDA